MKIAMVQIGASNIENYDKTIDKIMVLCGKAAEKNPDFILFPECTYPGYMIGIDEKITENAMKNTTILINKISLKAKQNKCYIAFGTVLKSENGYENAALVFDRNGNIIHKHVKSNMWHFDRKSFVQGRKFDIFDTDMGKMGVIICADGRLPESCAVLAKKGAKLIMDLTNLTSSAYDVKKLSNQQYEFMLQTRAAENGVYIAVCCKSGTENNCVKNLGRSMIINPEGKILKELPPDTEEILFDEINLKNKTDNNSMINISSAEYNNLFGLLCEKTENLPVLKIMNEKYDISKCQYFTSAVKFNAKNTEEYCKKAEEYFKLNTLCDGNIIVLPQTDFSEVNEMLFERLKNLVGKEQYAVVSSYDVNGKYAFLFNSKSILCFWRKIENNGGISCADTKYGKVGVIFDKEIMVPEISRVYTLDGCHIIIHYDDKRKNLTEKVVRCRASENRVFVIRIGKESDDSAMIVSPLGAVLSQSCKGEEMIINAYTMPSESANKSVVPGTDVVLGRTPESYKVLTD
ncbi:MAG: carbon-nitrogen hydrolase family protein [Clostridia bacterium]|jgi:predicted amidohydrolase|nr:carbon-nitrogen hydrolase family protein [Clostridia bacterium]